MTASAQERYIGSYKRSHLFVYGENDIPSIAYTNLSLSMELHPGNGPALQVYTTINNLFDKDYPLVPLSANPGLSTATFRSIYVVVGCYYTLGVRATVCHPMHSTGDPS